jgi:hypothetical protein
MTAPLARPARRRAQSAGPNDKLRAKQLSDGSLRRPESANVPAERHTGWHLGEVMAWWVGSAPERVVHAAVHLVPRRAVQQRLLLVLRAAAGRRFGSVQHKDEHALTMTRVNIHIRTCARPGEGSGDVESRTAHRFFVGGTAISFGERFVQHLRSEIGDRRSNWRIEALHIQAPLNIQDVRRCTRFAGI